MDDSTTMLFGVVALIAINQAMMRLGALKGHVWFFWSIQVVNVVTGSMLIWFGLPGFESVRPVSYVVALLFFFRTVQNTNARGVWLRERQVADSDLARKTVLAALHSEEE